MMQFNNNNLSIFLLVFILLGCDNNSNLEFKNPIKNIPLKTPELNLHKQPEPSNAYYYVTITSKENKLLIKKITVNRENCMLDLNEMDAALSFFGKNPKQKNFIDQNDIGVAVEFGESFGFIAWCNPLEVNVETDHGNVVYSWNQ